MAEARSASTEAVRFSDSWASVLLDLVRGLAAILVLLSHWKVMFFNDYPKIPGVRWMFAAPYALCDAGHQAVIIFFVLSGYLISGSIFRALQRGRWSWLEYLVHRLTRLWVVLIPGLLLGALLDWIGMHHARYPSLYQGSPKAHSWVVTGGTSLPIFLGNAFFLQTLYFPVFGSNASLWSLSNEFWYYMLFPLGLLCFRSEFGWAKRVGWLVLGLALAWMIRKPLLPLFPLWMAGASLDFLPKARLGPGIRWLASVVYVPSVLVFAKVHLPDWQRDYGFCLVTVLFLWVLLSARGERAKGALCDPIRQLARFSFSLYVVHMPVLLFVTALLVGERTWNPKNVRVDALALAVLGGVLLLAYALATVTEFQNDRVRGWVERQLGAVGYGRRSATRASE